jgi:transcriptional regulator with XRE-family HTH domain
MNIKDLSVKLNTDEETIEKWLSGLYNLDLKTIAKLEIAIGEPLFWIPCYLADFTDAKTLFKIGFEIIIDDFKIFCIRKYNILLKTYRDWLAMSFILLI